MAAKQNEFFDFLKATFTAPGSGVFTVHTGQDKRLKVQSALYSPTQGDFIESWKNSLSGYAAHEGFTVFGIASDTGGGIQRGANWGPLALREYLYTQEWAKSWSRAFFDLGDVRVNPQLLRDELLNENTLRACKRAMYGDESSPYPASPLSIAESFAKLHHQVFPKKKLLMLGGDHSVTYPVLKEFIRAKRSAGKNVAVVHFDAHTDLLDERLGIDICFGTWASHILKELASPDLMVQIGIRSSGKPKEYWEKTKGIKQFWADEVHEDGAALVTQRIVSHLLAQKIDTLYISFDIDALDAQDAGATGTPENNGLKTLDCVDMIEELKKHFSLDGADVVEVAPFVQYSHEPQEPDRTLKNACKLIHALSR